MLRHFKEKSKALLLIVAAMVGLASPLLAPLSAKADTKDAACTGFSEVLGESCDSGGGEEEINSTITDIIDILSAVVSVISVIMIIIAGIKFVTASGDPGSVKSARNTVIYALVGLLIVALSQTIVKFVVGNVVNQDGGPIGNNQMPQ